MLGSRSVTPFLLTSVVAITVAVTACTSEEPNNGVNDVKAACEIRAAWKRAETEDCRNCMAAAPLVSCECETVKAYSGLCKDQGDVRIREPSCSDTVEQCVTTCPRTDCACVEACYSRAEACKKASAARDGCVADVCAKYCD